jgi:hypothetical protein
MTISTQLKQNQTMKKSREDILAELEELRLEKYEILVEERFPYAQIRKERHGTSKP